VGLLGQPGVAAPLAGPREGARDFTTACAAHCLYADPTCQLSTHLLHTQGIDGIVLMVDVQHPEAEKELEALYMAFAQPAALTVKACLVIGMQVRLRRGGN
jgi:hypothetical protein